MKEILLKFLMQYQYLGLPGIGSLQLYIRASQTDIANKRVLPPTPAFQFSNEPVTVSDRTLVRYIAQQMGVSEEVADRQLKDYCTASVEGIRRGERLEWRGLGHIAKGVAGDMKFELTAKHIFAYEAVPAERVIRTNADHTILVGDREKTKTEMTELLLEDEPRRRWPWWVAALILGGVGLAVLAYYWYTHRESLQFFRNQQSFL